MDKDNDALMDRLRRLDAAPPEGLLERCLDTIPSPATTPLRREETRKRGTVMKPLIGTAVAAACLLIFLPALRQGKTPLTPAPAFAATEEAMRHTDRWQMTERSRVGAGEEGQRNGKWFSPDQWVDSKTWFDAERGVLTEIYDDPEAREEARHLLRDRLLEPANGERHNRHWDDATKQEKVVIDENPIKWEDRRAQEISKVTTADSLSLNALMRVVASHLKSNNIVKVKAKNTLLREESDATERTFTFRVEQREPENLPLVVPEIRLVIHTDPESKRIQRAEQYVIEQEGAAPTLINVNTFDYVDIPAEKFDPEAFAQGAVIEREP